MSLSDKTICALAGLPASGKSAVATRLNKMVDSVLLDKDRVRDILFQQHVDYSNAQNDLCVDMIYQATLYLLAREAPPVVIIDGRSYSRTYQIDRLKEVAAEAQSRLYIVECVCSAESTKQRLLQDKGVHLAQDRDYDLFLRSRADAEAIKESRLTLDTDKLSADECAKRALAYLAGLA